jgi:YfiR/HmsC-like
MKRRSGVGSFIGALVVSWLPTPAAAIGPSTAELAVKATYIVKFASYITWPADKLRPGAPIVICVTGRDPFGAVLDRAAAGQETNGHPFIVRRVESARQAENCNFAYLGGSSRDVSIALAATATRPIVTVSDARTSKTYAMIHFQIVGDRVKFDIDAGAASRSGIKISSKLLGLARKIHLEKAR